MNVDRYDLDPKGLCDGDGGRCYAQMGITLTGDFVLYADFLKALQAEYRTKELREAFVAGFEHCESVGRGYTSAKLEAEALRRYPEVKL